MSQAWKGEQEEQESWEKSMQNGQECGQRNVQSPSGVEGLSWGAVGGHTGKYSDGEAVGEP